MNKELKNKIKTIIAEICEVNEKLKDHDDLIAWRKNWGNYTNLMYNKLWKTIRDECKDPEIELCHEYYNLYLHIHPHTPNHKVHIVRSGPLAYSPIDWKYYRDI